MNTIRGDGKGQGLVPTACPDSLVKNYRIDIVDTRDIW